MKKLLSYLLLTFVLLSANASAMVDSALLYSVPQDGSQTSAFDVNPRDGLFHVQASLNDSPTECIFDTGASVILLDTDMAQAAGIRLEDLDFSQQGYTANGSTKVAISSIKTLTLQGMEFHNVQVFVNDAKLPYCLLGMGFISMLREYNIEGKKLTIAY